MQEAFNRSKISTKRACPRYHRGQLLEIEVRLLACSSCHPLLSVDLCLRDTITIRKRIKFPNWSLESAQKLLKILKKMPSIQVLILNSLRDNKHKHWQILHLRLRRRQSLLVTQDKVGNWTTELPCCWISKLLREQWDQWWHTPQRVRWSMLDWVFKTRVGQMMGKRCKW